jgi:hypothetical protein
MFGSYLSPAALRLVHVPSLAADGPGDVCGSHSFLAQSDDAGAVKRGWTAFVNPLRFRGLDTGALSITDEAKLHLCDDAEQGRNHLAYPAVDCQQPTSAHTGSGGGNPGIGNAEG